MKRYHVRVWTLSASYVKHVLALSESQALKAVKSSVMQDMKGWNFTVQEADDECENGDC